MKFRGKEIIDVHKPDYRFALELEDGSVELIGPNDLPLDSYKWLFVQLKKSHNKKSGIPSGSTP